MYEKVNRSHPDKIADRIAGALVDMAYGLQANPRIAVEVLCGHGWCDIIAETSVYLDYDDIASAVRRITEDEDMRIDYEEYKQDPILARNQQGKIRCGDNGIFKGTPITDEQKKLAKIAKEIYDKYPYDGKYILDESAGKLVICQSHAKTEDLQKEYPNAVINPLGYWTGGPNVDTGATNRKLGSDMGDSVTGGGVNAKDYSKADVSINIYAFIKAQQTGKPVELSCAIGDEYVDGKPYSEIVEIAKQYINYVGGFEKFAEEGLIRSEYEYDPDWYKAYKL